MLGDSEAIATIAVKDLTVARKFYEGTLGLEVARATGSEALTFKTGRSELIVYRSQHAGSNKATAVNWRVGDDIESIVKALGAKGVVFEHYDLPGLTQKGDVHAFGEFKSAWFKDPDGNIIALMSF
ncbi:MAG TPA: VOC family protein [Polyangia bacterium]|jgi:catechol 2,3-dioxygenase-like lactoylglutathione lyase family enzyme|nr:VOC family protein [Polyangia bacterium]